jgi:hypothetical protein
LGTGSHHFWKLVQEAGTKIEVPDAFINRYNKTSLGVLHCTYSCRWSRMELNICKKHKS